MSNTDSDEVIKLFAGRIFTLLFTQCKLWLGGSLIDLNKHNPTVEQYAGYQGSFMHMLTIVTREESGKRLLVTLKITSGVDMHKFIPYLLNA